MKYFLKMIFMLIISLFVLYLIKTVAWQKEKIAHLQSMIEQKEKENRSKDIRIDKISEVVSNIAMAYPEVGENIHEILVDLKDNLSIGIDQRLADLPDDMQSLIINQKINANGLEHYGVVDEGYVFPVDYETSYVSSKWGEFTWRPEIYDENTLEYVYNPKVKVTKWVLHGAWDFVNHRKPEVVAANYGLVIQIGYDKKGGNFAIIEHRVDGKPLRRTGYFHLSEIYVEQGQYVKRGELIGLIGKSGKTVTTDLLHFEYKEYAQTPYGMRWVQKNFLYGTTHNNNRISGYYWIKIDDRWLLKVL
jgi:murein DD-endopeptidase MepM/ murein hydrolase activator NlpD